jgi:hypothetical protein
MAVAALAPMDLKVDLGPMPMDEQCGGITEGLRSLLQESELCDIVLVAGGQSFPAHLVVLAAVAPKFNDRMQQSADPSADASAAPASQCADGASAMDDQQCTSATEAPPTVVAGCEGQKSELRLDKISHPEAVRAMLDCIYGAGAAGAGEYNPSSDEVNCDVLRLAQQFQIAPLLDQSSKWLLRNLSTTNALERLQACEEFGLVDVRDKILEQLVANPQALLILAKDPEMTKVPTVLQDMLVRILKLLGVTDTPPANGATKETIAPAAPAARASTKTGGGGGAGGKAGKAEGTQGMAKVGRKAGA